MLLKVNDRNLIDPVPDLVHRWVSGTLGVELLLQIASEPASEISSPCSDPTRSGVSSVPSPLRADTDPGVPAGLSVREEDAAGCEEELRAKARCFSASSAAIRSLRDLVAGAEASRPRAPSTAGFWAVMLPKRLRRTWYPGTKRRVT